jgi:uncharacterized protein with ParB-like and HNH nuclease domain
MADYYDMETEDTSIESYDISVSPNDFNVLTVFSLLEKGVITMPSFQRNYVWDRKRASKFIESLILGLPIPQIFLYQKERNKYSVIDGQQRLMSIYFFIKQRFPKPGKRAFLRKQFDENGGIPDEILNDNNFFQDFKLQFAKLENGKAHPLNGKKYKTLDESNKGDLELMPVRCMSIRQNKPDDDSSIYEIFSRLNTGGLNLSPQEIRGCLYNSKFYDEIYKMNTDSCWRKIIGREQEDDKFRDVEIILRSFALLYNHDRYTGTMISFLNKFSKQAQGFTEEEVENCKRTFEGVLDRLKDIDANIFLTKNKRFNVSFFDSVFVVIGEELRKGHNVSIDQDKLMNLKADEEFKKAITHSTSHKDNVRLRLNKARSYLLQGVNADGK